MARRKVEKQPYYVGEVIVDDAGETYGVVAVLEGGGFWRVEIVSKKDGHMGSFDARGPSKYWELIQPGEERLWNL